MPYSDYRPELMGTATLVPSGTFEAGSLQSFVLTYTAGRFGVDDTGSIKIGFRFATDFGPVQFEDPQGQGYTTAEASNGAVLELKWEFKRNIRPWSRSLYIGIAKHFLRPGDTIAIRFGDRRFGSPGIRLQTYAERHFEFHVLVDAIATYDYVPLPESPSIEIAPGPGVKWCAVIPTRVRRGETFRLAVKVDDKWGNPSDHFSGELGLSTAGRILGLPSNLKLDRGAFAAIVEGLTAQSGGVIEVRDGKGTLLCVSNPIEVVDEPRGLRHYWGDLHGQSDETLGTNSARDYFSFGRDKAFLDVMGHQGNDFQISGSFWAELNRLTRAFDEPGRFVCIPGYEWSANTAVGGDRNVFFRHEGETIHRSSHAQIYDGVDREDETDAHTADDLFAKLKDRDCVVMAHVGGRYADIVLAHDPVLETAVEVHSAWGTFEWLLQDAFDAEYRVGVVCNSDGHKGRPGACYPGASFFGSYGGLTCFIAERLDRDAIFAAMRRRHHYGTTGNRMILDIEANVAGGAELFRRDPAVFEGASAIRSDRLIMGDIARIPREDIDLKVRVVGSAPLERVEIFDGDRLVDRLRTFTAADLGARVRLLYRGAEYRGRARTTNWDGFLEIEGNEILRADVINNWNLDRGIQRQTPTSIEWKAVTTGNHGAIDIWLKNGLEGRIAFETRHARGQRAIAALGYERHVFSAGGLDRAVKLFRLPERMTEVRLNAKRRIRLRDRGDTRLFVRVTQEDGHCAWSSPVYLFR